MARVVKVPLDKILQERWLFWIINAFVNIEPCPMSKTIQTWGGKLGSNIDFFWLDLDEPIR